MNKLITAALKYGEIEPLVRFPQELMNDQEKAIVTWIARFQRMHGQLPNIQRVEKQFNNFVAITIGKKEPLADILEQEINEKRKEFIRENIAAIDEQMALDGEIPLDRLNAIASVMATTQGGVVRYREFNRDVYFRMGDGLSTGFRLIDRSTGGIKRGDYALVTGRLGSGKTTWASFLVNRWWQEGKRILYVSQESTWVDVFLRQDSIMGKFNPLRIRNGDDINGLRNQLRVVETANQQYSGEIIVPVSRINTPYKVGAMAKYLNIDVIVIDGLYLMSADQRTNAKWERVSEISNALKQLAIDLELPIVGITQIKRVGDKEEYDAEDLAYSDALGQDADFIWALKQDKDKSSGHLLEIQTIKNRYGPAESALAEIDFESMTFIERLDQLEDAEEEDWTSH